MEAAGRVAGETVGLRGRRDRRRPFVFVEQSPEKVASGQWPVASKNRTAVESGGSPMKSGSGKGTRAAVKRPQQSGEWIGMEREKEVAGGQRSVARGGSGRRAPGAGE